MSTFHGLAAEVFDKFVANGTACSPAGHALGHVDERGEVDGLRLASQAQAALDELLAQAGRRHP